MDPTRVLVNLYFSGTSIPCIAGILSYGKEWLIGLNTSLLDKSAGIPAHGQFARPGEIRSHWRVRQRSLKSHVVKPAEKSLQPDTHLGFGQMGFRGSMCTGRKPQMSPTICSMQVKRSGSAKIEGSRFAAPSMQLTVSWGENSMPCHSNGSVDVARGRLEDRAEPSHGSSMTCGSMVTSRWACSKTSGCSNIAHRLFSSNASTVDMPPKNRWTNFA